MLSFDCLAKAQGVTCAVQIGHVLNTDMGPLRLGSSKLKDKEEAVVVVETDSVETQEGRVDARCRFDCKVRQQLYCSVKTAMPASRFYIEINGWPSYYYCSYLTRVQTSTRQLTSTSDRAKVVAQKNEVGR